MGRLADYTATLREQSNKHLAGRYLACAARGRGDPVLALSVAEAQHQFADRPALVMAHKAAITPIDTSNYPGAFTPVASAFLGTMRPYSVALQLSDYVRRVPMLTRIYVSSTGVTAAEVLEGASIPVLSGVWTTVTLTPRKHGGITVHTDELIASMDVVATDALQDDLAQSTAEAENFSFVSPDVSGSILNGQANFISAGSTLANVDADLSTLVNDVPTAYRPGAHFLMTMHDATFLSLLRGTGGALAYPDVSPQGGTLLGLPVLITSACTFAGSPNVRCIGLVSPSEVFYADDKKVLLFASNQASLKMDDAATAAAGNLTSMYATNSTALRAIRECAWHATPGCAAYFVTGY